MCCLSSRHARSYACRGWKTAAWAENTAAGRRRRRHRSATARTVLTPEGAPGFHAHYMVPESPERAPELPTPQRTPEQPFPWLAPAQLAREQAEAVGPMMENFDTFLNYYEPTDEQVSLGSLLLLGIGNPDTTMEWLLMSMLGSLEAHAEAAEAGIDF